MDEPRPDREKKEKQPQRRDERSVELEADREVAKQLLDGDRDALRQWLQRHMAHVYGYLLRRIGPGGEKLAGEVTNATFETAAKRLRTYARGGVTTPMRLWLLKLAGDQLARRRSRWAQTGTFAQPGDSPGMAQMRAAVHRLAPRKQAALSLALMEGLSGDELAAALGMRLPRAMGLLRAAIKDVGNYLSTQPLSDEEGD